MATNLPALSIVTKNVLPALSPQACVLIADNPADNYREPSPGRPLWSTLSEITDRTAMPPNLHSKHAAPATLVDSRPHHRLNGHATPTSIPARSPLVVIKNDPSLPGWRTWPTIGGITD